MRYDYDMLGNRIHSQHGGWRALDAERRRGQADPAWDSRGHEFRTEYDRTAPPVTRRVCGSDESDPACRAGMVVRKIDYGEGQRRRGEPAHARRIKSLRRRRRRHQRRVRLQRQSAARHAPASARTTRHTGLGRNRGPRTGIFANRTTYDALNRPISLVSPDDSVNQTHLQRS